MGGWLQDLGYALRSLRKSPGFTAVAILTMALGIGATAAIFSVAHAVLFAPLPYGEPDEVVTIWASWSDFPDKTWVAEDEFRLWRQESRTLEDAALYQRGNATFTDPENPERVGAASVTPNLFDVLRVHPVRGRVFTWEEARIEDPPVLLAHSAWRRRWSADPSVVGRTVDIDGAPRTVVGVLPEGFGLPVDFSDASAAEVYEPLWVDLESPAPDLGSGGSHGSYAVGRLRDGVTVEQARADLERVQAGVPPRGLYAPERGFRPRVFGALDDVVGTADTTLWLLLGTVVFVLLIACGNVANLLLARAETRVAEMAVRSAMGASRGRIVRQLLLESGVVAAVAGLVGMLIAAAGLGALLAIDPAAVPRSGDVGLDATVVLFTVAVCLATALLFGAAPALRVSRGGSARALREDGGRGSEGRRARRTQGILVSAQMAMAVVLLTGSVLMARTFVRLLEVDPGFEAGDVLTARLTVPAVGYPEQADVAGFYEELLRRIREIPGVEGAGAGRILPLVTTMGDRGFRVPGYEPGPNESMQAEWQWATPGYLEVMGIPLLAGRTFDSRDRTDAPLSVIVNESFARRYFDGRDPVGLPVAFSATDTGTVVGVVGDVVHNGITASPRVRFYLPHAQVPVSNRSMTLTVATAGPPLEVLEEVRAAVHSLDPSLAVAEVRTLEDVVSTALASSRFVLVLLAVFALVAFTLALVGIYGVLSYAVSRRTREIGVRMAIGAERGRVVGMVVRQGMVLAVLGVVLGTGAALGLSRFMESLLYGVAPRDPVTFVGVPVLFVLTALAACVVPAVRAARTDPATALRHE